MNSTVQDSKGLRRIISDVIASGRIGELQFESATGGGTVEFPGISKEFWDVLLAEAVSKQLDDVWIRARRQPDQMRKPKKSVWEFERESGRIYGRMRRHFLNRRLEPDQRESFFAGLIELFLNEEGACEFSRNSTLLAMSVADYLERHERKFAFQYDSQQHSAIVRLILDSSDGSAVARGLCAYTISGTEEEFDVTWEDASWHLMSDGLILAGNAS